MFRRRRLWHYSAVHIIKGPNLFSLYIYKIHFYYILAGGRGWWVKGDEYDWNEMCLVQIRKAKGCIKHITSRPAPYIPESKNSKFYLIHTSIVYFLYLILCISTHTTHRRSFFFPYNTRTTNTTCRMFYSFRDQCVH